MTDYLVYIYAVRGDSSKEIGCIGLVENEKPKADSPSVYGVYQKRGGELEDTGKIIIKGKCSGSILNTIAQGIMTVAGGTIDI